MIMNAVRKFLPTAGSAGRSEDIDRALAEIDERIAEAQHRLDTAEQSRGAAMMESDAAGSRNRETIASAREDVIDLKAMRAKVIEKLDVAKAQEAETARRARYDAAKAAQRGAVKAIETRLAKHVAEHYSLIRFIEEARAAVETANADLPIGAAPLEDAEAQLRDGAALPRRTLSETKEIVWVRLDLFPPRRIDPDQLPSFRQTGPGTAEFDGLNTYGYPVVVQCQGRIDVTRSYEVAEQGNFGSRLRMVPMPGLAWFDRGYVPPDYANPSPADILAAIDEASKPAARPDVRRYVRTETFSEPLPELEGGYRPASRAEIAASPVTDLLQVHSPGRRARASMGRSAR